MLYNTTDCHTRFERQVINIQGHKTKMYDRNNYVYSTNNDANTNQRPKIKMHHFSVTKKCKSTIFLPARDCTCFEPGIFSTKVSQTHSFISFRIPYLKTACRRRCCNVCVCLISRKIIAYCGDRSCLFKAANTPCGGKPETK